MNPETKQMLLNLLEDIPDDIILAKYTEKDGIWNCKRMKEDIENDGEYSKDYFSNLFRMSRDFLIRKINKYGQ